MPQAAKKREQSRKNDVIQVRASSEVKSLISRAAELRGQTLSEFVLETLRSRAQDVVLDQRIFVLSPKDHERFLALLDSPPPPTKALRDLFKRKALWEQ